MPNFFFTHTIIQLIINIKMKKIYPIIFQKFLKNNNNFNTPLLKTNDNKVGTTKYFPPVSKEWKNSLFFYNIKKTNNLPVFDSFFDKIITAFFNSYFKTSKFIKKAKYNSINKSFRQIYLSKSELKHTYSKVIVTIYIYNKQKKSLLRKIKNFSYNYFFKKVSLTSYTLKRYLDKSFSKKIKLKIITLNKLLMLLERYKFKFNLNKFKFEEGFLSILANILSKFYKKKIEFNIVDLKSVVYNSDIFTKILGLKSKKKRISPVRNMKFLLKKVILPKINKVKEKNNLRKSVNMNLLENKYKNLDLNSIKNSNFDEWLNNIYPFYNTNESKKELHKIIFNSIHYKNMGGIRLEIKGRLTRRYRADRAKLKVRWKGGLKNIDSSYKRLPSIMKRGYTEYNLDYSLFTSKRHIGAFAVKGWISGK